MKHYRPHILVAIALVVVLMSGWHDAFRNALADLRFQLVATRRRRRRRRRCHRHALDRENRRLAMAAPAPCRHASPAGEGWCPRHRLRRRFQCAVGPGVRSRLRRGVARRGGLGDPAVVPAAWRRSGQSSRAPYQSSAETVRRSILGGAGQHRHRTRRSCAPLSLRRQARRRISAVDGRHAGRAVHQQRRALPDRLRHSRGLGAVGLLRRRAARRCGDPRKAQGQESHRRRHRARARRPLQRSERPNPVWPCAAGCRRRVDAAEPDPALDLRSGHADAIGRDFADHDVCLAALQTRRPGDDTARDCCRRRDIGDAVAGQLAAHSRYVAAVHCDRRLPRRDGARRDRFSRASRPHRRTALPSHRDVARRWSCLHRPASPHHVLESGRRSDFRLFRRRDDRQAHRLDLRRR